MAWSDDAPPAELRASAGSNGHTMRDGLRSAPLERDDSADWKTVERIQTGAGPKSMVRARRTADRCIRTHLATITRERRSDRPRDRLAARASEATGGLLGQSGRNGAPLPTIAFLLVRTPDTVGLTFSIPVAPMVNVLVLTATITPPSGEPNLARTDPSVRLKDYEDVLRKYVRTLGKTFDRLVFAENSASDVGSLKDIVRDHSCGDKVEFLSINGLDYSPRHGRGYGEFKLIDHVMSNSEFIKKTANSDRIWKCTGRYYIRNVDKIVKSYKGHSVLYCNYRDWTRRVVDMYIMGWTKHGYEKYLRGVYPRLSVDAPEQGREPHTEELLRQILDDHHDTSDIVKRLKYTPIIDGVRAADNRSYYNDDRMKYLVRAACRRVLPGIWI